MDDPVAVGRRLREARVQAGLSQRQLAFEGCSPAYVCRIEAGERTPSLQLLRELGRRLDVSEDYLATGAVSAAEAIPPALRDAEIALRLDDVDEAERLFEAALTADPETSVRSRALEGLGQIALRGGDPRRAIELLEAALDTSDGDVASHPGLSESLARSYAAVGEIGRAIAILERCLERVERDPVQYVRFASLLGYALTDAGRFDDAERVLVNALERGRSVTDPYTRVRLYWSESRLRLEQGQSEAAEVYARRALETLRTTEDTYAIAHAMQGLAHVYLDLDRAHEALELLDEGWPLISASATPLELAQYRIDQARALAALGQREEAAALAMRVTADLRETHTVDAGRAYTLLAEIFAELGEPARAREVLELAVELLEQRGPTRYLVSAYKRLAELLKEQGERDGALDLLERALGVQDRAGRALR